ncbi:LolA family protein [Anaerosolibacter sp.]|uniref:LolA family protein n=1 Tax=Anaerosolibacter sp. TaxID=1872527 RepID=UPI0039EF0BE0
MKCLKIVFVLFMVVILFGCGPKTDEDLFYDVQKMMSRIDSYACVAEITVKGNLTPETYIFKQWFRKPNKFKLELIEPESLNGKITIYDGRKASIIHPQINQVWFMESFQHTDEQNMFLGYFLQNYLESEDVEIHREVKGGETFLVVDTEIPGNHVYFHRQRLWVNIEKMEPELLQVFDGNDGMRIEVRYFNFQYNPKLEDHLFIVPESLEK